MWIRFENGSFDFGDFDCYEKDDINCWWKGIFFIPGYKAGKDSVAELVRRYKREEKLDFINFMGSFNFVIKEKEDFIIFTDNGISSCFFYDKEKISDSMLDIVKDNNGLEFNDKNICQYLVYNKIFFEETYLKGVFYTNSSKYYIVKEGRLHEKCKDIGTLNDIGYGISTEEFSEYICKALPEVKKTISLTGGFDSRYVLSLFLNRCQIAASVSGGDSVDNGKHPDFVVSKKVAEIASIDYTQVKVSKPIIDEEYIRKAFLERGGYFNTLNDANFRLNEYLKQRRKAGFKCLMTGDSGVFHKSDDWYQYFPFYNCKHFSLKRVYNNFILGIKRKLPIDDRLWELNKDIEKKLVLWIEKQRQEINTKNLDWLNWYLLRAASYAPLYNGQKHIICSYPPLLEYRFVVYSYNLPRKSRAFSKSMKEYITKINPAVAKIPTATGVTTSSQVKYLIPDTWFSFFNLFKSALRLFGRKVFRKNILTKNIISWSCEKEIRSLELSDKAIDFAKKKKWISSECRDEQIPYDMLCKLLEIYLLKEYAQN